MCILQHTSKLNELCNSQRTPLSYLIQSSRTESEKIELLNKFLERGADVNLGESNPLLLACSKGHLEIVRILRKHTSDIISPVIIASKSGHAYIVEEFTRSQQAGVETILQGTLEDIARLGHSNVFDIFIKYNFSWIHSIDPSSFLDSACYGGNLSMIKFFLENQKFHFRAHRNPVDYDIQIAMAFGNYDCVIPFSFYVLS